MRFKKTTLAALCLAFVSVVAYSAAGDRYFSNPTLNKDVVIQVNKAGVTTDALKVTGSTGAVNVGGAFTGASTLTLTAGSLNIGTGESLQIKNASGVTRQVVTIDVSNNTSLGGTVDGGIKFYGGTGNERGSMTGAGVWTLGPSSLGSAHAINGGISIKGGPSIRQMAPQTGAINADGGNGFVNFSFSIAVLDTAKTSCTANIKDGSGSYLGAAIACDMVDSFSCRCRVTGRTSGTVQALLMEWY